VTNILRNNLFPKEIHTLLRTLSNVGFFDRSTLIGSWVMPIFQEIYHATYVLKTLDVDFAVHVAHSNSCLRADLEQIITSLGFVDYVSAGGVQKFSSGGYEVEFIAHRKGSRNDDAMQVREWNIVAQPLPLISLLLDFSEEALLDDFIIRYPVPEAFFIHKLIVAQKRRSPAKQSKDLEQCAVLMNILRDDPLLHIMESVRLGRGTKGHLRTSCTALNFPLHRLGL